MAAVVEANADDLLWVGDRGEQLDFSKGAHGAVRKGLRSRSSTLLDRRAEIGKPSLGDQLPQRTAFWLFQSAPRIDYRAID